MKRTQIYLKEDTIAYLTKESKLRNKTMSELIRDSIDLNTENEIIKIKKSLEGVFGIKKDNTNNVEKQVRELREDRTI